MIDAQTNLASTDRRVTVEIRVLGGFAVLVNGQPLAARGWGSRKAQHLIKLLALAPGHHLTTDSLADTLWPDLDPDAARRACYQAVYLARKVLDPDHIGLLVLQQETLALHAPAGLTVDLATFQAAARRAEQTRHPADYAAALARYTGEVLPEDRYAEWAILPRETAQQQYHQLLGASATLATTRRRFDEARGLWQRLLASDPANEAAHVALMRLYAAEGQRREALEQFRLLRAALRRDLDAEPEAASQQLYAAILAGRVPEVGSRKSEVGSGEERGKARHNLPATTTALLGRAAAIAAIRAELAAARLVTLVGSGGIGKTRLALALGQALLADYPGGVWLVDLAALQDGALLDATLARVLSVREQAGRPLREMVVAALRDHPTLIVLDNCEHLIDACADLAAALLANCPDLRVLATSREALRVAGELVWRVPSLPVPGERIDLAALRDNPAVGLFLDRARFARSDFALSAENGAAVAAICRRLDGVPLALELAAARVAMLTPQQLATRLDDALRLLTGGPRTALPRHQTLRATLEWSHRLLTPDEQALLARLAVFAGGGTLAAIEAVCEEVRSTNDEVRTGPSPGTPFIRTSHFPLPTSSVLDMLAALVEKSLVQVELGNEEEEPRYRLLETVRQFAAERLAAGGEEAACRARHADHFLANAEEAEPHLRGEQQAHWLPRVTREIGNIRAARTWFERHARSAASLRLANALERFWLTGAYLPEGLRWLEVDLARADETMPTPVRAKAHRVAALLGLYGGSDRTIQHAEGSLALYRALGDREGQAMVSNTLGMAARAGGDQERARAAFEEARTLWRATSDMRGVVVASANLASLHSDRDEWMSCAAILEELMPLARPFRGSQMFPLILLELSFSYAMLGRFDEVVTPLAEALDLLTTLNNWIDLTGILLTLALLANGRGDADRAAEFLGAHARLMALFNRSQGTESHRYALAADAARATLGDATFAAAYDDGYAWSIEGCIAQARAYLAV